MSRKNELGKRGELLAADFLRQNGYEILHTNWRFEKAELDIIARKDKIIVFAEVKTRSSDKYGNPEESVSESKQSHLHRAAEAFIEQNKITSEIRFDIISIILKNNSPLIEHFEDAFFPK